MYSETHFMTTGNTVYHSDDGMFSSMSENAVKNWEASNKFNCVEDMDTPSILYWATRGNLKGGFAEYEKRCRAIRAEKERFNALTPLQQFRERCSK